MSHYNPTADEIKDKDFVRYMYLDYSIDNLIEKMRNLTFNEFGNEKLIPFYAQIRSYTGAVDTDGEVWLVKEIEDDEVYMHKVQEVAYYLDFMMHTLAAPTVLVKYKGKYYRATKNIKNAMQIGSYNYMEEPFKSIIANDLINRWLFCDEDRNPNNYLVHHDTDSSPLIVAIDYNKADLWTEGLKITGRDDDFGWERTGKNRFLTLLAPENFKNLSIDVFNERLNLLMDISENTLRDICVKTFEGVLENVPGSSDLITKNILQRRMYINDYFRTWFKPKDTEKEKAENDRYAGMGQSFLNYYKKKQ